MCLIRPETRHGAPNSNFSKLSRASKVQMIWNTAPSVIPNTQVVCSWITEVLKGSLLLLARCQDSYFSWTRLIWTGPCNYCFSCYWLLQVVTQIYKRILSLFKLLLTHRWNEERKRERCTRLTSFILSVNGAEKQNLQEHSGLTLSILL